MYDDQSSDSEEVDGLFGVIVAASVVVGAAGVAGVAAAAGVDVDVEVVIVAVESVVGVDDSGSR